jgi:hypothetical protein
VMFGEIVMSSSPQVGVLADNYRATRSIVPSIYVI